MTGMDDPLLVAALVTEVLGWVGGSVGVLLFLAGVLLGGALSRWATADGVIVEVDGHDAEEHGPMLRWLDEDGEIRDDHDPHGLHRGLEPGDAVTVHYRPARPERGRLEHPRRMWRPLRTLGLVVLGFGVLSSIVSFALGLVG